MRSDSDAELQRQRSLDGCGEGSGRMPVESLGSNPLRARPSVRRMLGKPLLEVSDLGLPLVVREAPDTEGPLPSVTLDGIPQRATKISGLGIRAVKLFATDGTKDREASGATRQDSLMGRAIREFKEAAPELCVVTETCLCSYTDTGCCALLGADGRVDLEATQARLAEMAVLQARAGADVVGPAGMIEGGVSAVRGALDGAGYRDVAVQPHLILASSLFGVYRQAMGVAASDKHRRSFQIDLSRTEQAVEQAESFIEEGADMLLLEPALPVVDILVALKERIRRPVASFSTSGEFRLLQSGSGDGISGNEAAARELFAGLKRAGAEMTFTYGAEQLAAWLSDSSRDETYNPEQTPLN